MPRRAASISLFLVIWMSVSQVMGQFQVTCRMPHQRVLQYEAVRAEVRVVYHGAGSVMFGPDGEAQLDFAVEQKPGYPVDRRSTKLVFEPVELRPHVTADVVADLSRAHDIRRTGPYTIQALVRHRGRTYRSNRAYLDVSPGLTMRTLSIGVPGKEGGSCCYSLRTLHRGVGEYIFLRIEDKEADLCHGVYDLGRLIRVSEPILEIDPMGRAHVLHQSGPTRYTHSVYGPDGTPYHEKFYTKGTGIAHLEPDGEGALEVRGVMEYEGDLSTDRPVIRPFNPFE